MLNFKKSPKQITLLFVVLAAVLCLSGFAASALMNMTKGNNDLESPTQIEGKSTSNDVAGTTPTKNDTKNAGNGESMKNINLVTISYIDWKNKGNDAVGSPIINEITDSQKTAKLCQYFNSENLVIAQEAYRGIPKYYIDFHNGYVVAMYPDMHYCYIAEGVELDESGDPINFVLEGSTFQGYWANEAAYDYVLNLISGR